MTKQEARALAKARRRALDMQAVGSGMAQALFALPCWQQAGRCWRLPPCRTSRTQGLSCAALWRTASVCCCPGC